jgi:hypothetical protein
MSNIKNKVHKNKDLCDSWEFLKSSLNRNKFEDGDMDKLHSDIEEIIYAQSGRATVSQVVGILELVKHNFLNQQD